MSLVVVYLIFRLNPCFNGILKYKDGVDITLAWKAS